MRTRSQTRKENSIDLPTESPLRHYFIETDYGFKEIDFNLLSTLNVNPELEVNINFDEASWAWKANKQKMPNGCYKYLSVGKLRSGRSY